MIYLGIFKKCKIFCENHFQVNHKIFVLVGETGRRRLQPLFAGTFKSILMDYVTLVRLLDVRAACARVSARAGSLLVYWRHFAHGPKFQQAENWPHTCYAAQQLEIFPGIC